MEVQLGCSWDKIDKRWERCAKKRRGCFSKANSHAPFYSFGILCGSAELIDIHAGFLFQCCSLTPGCTITSFVTAGSGQLTARVRI